MTTLALTRGIPGSGKTTAAMQWLSSDPDGKRARVNRDDLRASMFGGQGVLSYAAEQAITSVQQATVRALLTSGTSVVVDDMNLRGKYARAWADLAVECGADLDVIDLTGVPVQVCIERDAARGASGGRHVGEQVIRDLHARFLGRPLPPITPTAAFPTAAAARMYVPDDDLPPAWLVDVDGTLALMNGRGPFEWHRVHEDTPNLPVVELVTALSTTAAIIVMSGRDAVCRAATVEWLHRHIEFDALHMRPQGDQRTDSVVKAELFWAEVAPHWNVRGVVDDRRQVVEMWRAMGLTVAQVAPGEF